MLYIRRDAIYTLSVWDGARSPGPEATVRALVFIAAGLLPVVAVAAWFVDLRLTPGRRPTPPRLADLFRECLQHDQDYAPAWARLARCERLLGKWALSESESAELLRAAKIDFERALALDPELPLTHSLYAQLEIDTGEPEDAMVRPRLRRCRALRSDPMDVMR